MFPFNLHDNNSLIISRRPVREVPRPQMLALEPEPLFVVQITHFTLYFTLTAPKGSAPT
jgi:hypothetical protein